MTERNRNDHAVALRMSRERKGQPLVQRLIAFAAAITIPMSVPSFALEGDIGIRNSAGRSGRYYLPQEYSEKAVPLAVLIHGTGGSGADMVSAFRTLADEYDFAIVAPDSRKSPDGQFTWQVGDRPDDLTEDFRHTMACIRTLKSMEGVRINPEKTLIVGYSGGGSSAPYISSHDSLFRSFAVLHGGVIPGGFGNNKVRGWFSTGESDPIRPPQGVREAAQQLRREGWSSSLEFKTFPGGHALSELERRDLIRWWLGR